MCKGKVRSGGRGPCVVSEDDVLASVDELAHGVELAGVGRRLHDDVLDDAAHVREAVGGPVRLTVRRRRVEARAVEDPVRALGG